MKPIRRFCVFFSFYYRTVQSWQLYGIELVLLVLKKIKKERGSDDIVSMRTGARFTRRFKIRYEQSTG